MSSGLLSLFGLARGGQLRAATEQAARLKRGAGDLKARLETTRRDVTRWKRKNEETAARLATVARDAERWKARDAAHVEELNALLDRFRRLESAEQHVELARGHLVTMETKLDVLEGAIAVLDRRTRDCLAPSPPDPVPAENGGTGQRE